MLSFPYGSAGISIAATTWRLPTEVPRAPDNRFRVPTQYRHCCRSTTRGGGAASRRSAPVESWSRHLRRSPVLSGLLLALLSRLVRRMVRPRLVRLERLVWLERLVSLWFSWTVLPAVRLSL